MKCYWCDEPALGPSNRFCVSCKDHLFDGLALANAAIRPNRPPVFFRDAWHARIWVLSGIGPAPAAGTPIYFDEPSPWKEFT